MRIYLQIWGWGIILCIFILHFSEHSSGSFHLHSCPFMAHLGYMWWSGLVLFSYYKHFWKCHSHVQERWFDSGQLGVGSSICQNPHSTGVIQMLAVFVTHPRRDNLFTCASVLGSTNLLSEHCVIYGDGSWWCKPSLPHPTAGASPSSEGTAKLPDGTGKQSQALSMPNAGTEGCNSVCVWKIMCRWDILFVI